MICYSANRPNYGPLQATAIQGEDV